MTAATPEMTALGVGEFASLTIGEIDTLTDDAVAITFAGAAEYGAAFAFREGQHLTLRRLFGGIDVRRTYSICTTPGSGRLRIGVRRISGGQMSTWLTQHAQVGDVIDVAPPSGDFGRQSAPTRGQAIGLIGAGSGVTPLLSIAATHLERDSTNSVLMVLGNRSSATLMLGENLADLKDRFTDRLQLVHAFSRERQVADGLNGRLDKARVAAILSSFTDGQHIAEWFLCGPKPVLDTARGVLLERGVSADRVHRELFFADRPPPTQVLTPAAAEGSVVVTLNGRTTTLTSGEISGSILEALLGRRSDAPFACKSGVCGTCRARCVSGEVSMTANYALEEAELAAGVVLTCQARPASPYVELEYL